MRTCGECHACCVSIRVESGPGDQVSVRKAAGVRCPCLTNGGRCAVYEQRPACCAVYTCAWLDGHGEDDERPDRCGAVIERAEGEGGLTLVFPSLAPGFAAHRRSYRDVLKRWRERGAVVLDGEPLDNLKTLRDLGVVIRFADGREVDFRGLGGMIGGSARD